MSENKVTLKESQGEKMRMPLGPDKVLIKDISEKFTF